MSVNQVLGEGEKEENKEAELYRGPEGLVEQRYIGERTKTTPERMKSMEY